MYFNVKNALLLSVTLGFISYSANVVAAPNIKQSPTKLISTEQTLDTSQELSNTSDGTSYTDYEIFNVLQSSTQTSTNEEKYIVDIQPRLPDSKKLSETSAFVKYVNGILDDPDVNSNSAVILKNTDDSKSILHAAKFVYSENAVGYTIKNIRMEKEYKEPNDYFNANPDAIAVEYHRADGNSMFRKKITKGDIFAAIHKYATSDGTVSSPIVGYVNNLFQEGKMSSSDIVKSNYFSTSMYSMIIYAVPAMIRVGYSYPSVMNALLELTDNFIDNQEAEFDVYTYVSNIWKKLNEVEQDKTKIRNFIAKATSMYLSLEEQMAPEQLLEMYNVEPNVNGITAREFLKQFLINPEMIKCFGICGDADGDGYYDTK